MDTVDASARYGQGAVEDKPSLLIVILDTNPYGWQELRGELPIQVALAHILLFLNAHLSFSHANQVAVIASHTKEVSFLYPTQPSSTAAGPATDTPIDSVDPYRDANKYRLFAQIENEVQASFRRLLSGTSTETLSGTSETMMAGALSMALAYINRICNAEHSDVGATIPRPGEIPRVDIPTMTAHILVVSVSGDLANQYVSIMNSIFAAQRLKVPIDVCKIAGDTVFLQQASDSTHGIYMQLQYPSALLQYLMSCFISDPTTRRHLIAPSQVNVDFRAACFCHKNVVDIGFVCSICLSSQCSPTSSPPPVISPPLERLEEWCEHTLGEEWNRRKQYTENLLVHSTETSISDDDNLSLPSETSWENSVQEDLTPEGMAIVQWWQDCNDHYRALEVRKLERRQRKLELFGPFYYSAKKRIKKRGKAQV